MSTSLRAHAPANPVTHGPLSTRHRGFDVVLEYAPAGFRYSIVHDGLVLHVSTAEHGTASSADRAARRFVDDALCVFEQPCVEDPASL